MLLNEFFLATNDREAGLAIPDGALVAGLDAVETAGLTTSGVAFIEEAARGKAPTSIDEAAAVAVARGGASGHPCFVYRVPAGVVGALLEVQAGSVQDVAERWATHHELKGAEIDVLASLVNSLIDLAIKGAEDGRTLYFWMSR